MSTACYIGRLLGLEEECDVQSSSQVKLSEIEENDIRLLEFRVLNFRKISTEFICSKHTERFLESYSLYYKSCCDPFKRHRKVVKANLTVLEIEICLKLKDPLKDVQLIPGQKVCGNCRFKIKNHLAELDKCDDPFEVHRLPVTNDLIKLDETICKNYYDAFSTKLRSDYNICKKCFEKIETDLYNSKTNSNPSSQGSSFCTRSQQQLTLDSMFESFGLPILSRGKDNDNDFKRKISFWIQIVIDVFSSAISRTFDVQLPTIQYSVLEDQSAFFRDMIMNLQSKYARETRIDKKISLLTLLPTYWTFQDVSQYFECSRYMWSSAKRIRETKGVLGGPLKKKDYHFISEEVKQSAIQFYYANSRMCPGMKESIKIKVPGEKSIPVQKMLLLHDLKDMYLDWKQSTNFERYPGFSTFAELRPKECVFAGSPGTHTVCVCPYHQNFKLKLNAIHCSLKTRDLIDKTVCSADNKVCMFRECDLCACNKNLIKQLLMDHSIVDNTVNYSNWEQITNKIEESTSNKTVLNRFEEDKDIFLGKLSADLWNLTTHHFVAESQKNFLSDSKRDLDAHTGLIMMDFAEKYAFIAQESTQGFYFNNTTATVHPLVLYYTDQESKKVTVQSFCIISGVSKQTASTVNVFQEKIVNYIKEELTFIKKLIYFSDGCPTQYKNKNLLINICHHKTDFGVEVLSYNFFSTSHGKNACDGIGAVVKRSTRRASLQNLWKNQILNPRQMFDYLNENEKQIKCFYVEEKEVKSREKKFKKRYDNSKTIPNTRQHHCFIPKDENTMEIKLYSSDSDSKIIKMN